MSIPASIINKQLDAGFSAISSGIARVKMIIYIKHKPIFYEILAYRIFSGTDYFRGC